MGRPLADHLIARGAGGRKLLVPYLTGGIPTAEDFPGALAALAPHADSLEVGLPYSDPLMDGPVISSASEQALAAGVGPLRALQLSATVSGVPRVAMTYYNPVHRVGERAFCQRAAAAGFAGLIVPDLPLEESASLRSHAADEGLGWVPLVAPTTPIGRVAALADTATGFVYGVSTLGVTGARDSLSERAGLVAAACKEATDLPVLVGIGVSTPQQARSAVRMADGVIVGSAIVRLAVEQGVGAATRLAAQMRNALDEAGRK
ncbi:tryptophan synthase subunit alpha [soil metagenome]